MPVIANLVMASFTAPEEIGTNPQSMLWLLPLIAAITIAYKATKLPRITAGNFIKEIATLFGSTIVFIIIVVLVMYAMAWLITE